MSFSYTTVHTSFKSLADDVKRMVAAYDAKQISDNDIDGILATWDINCRNLLYEDESRSVVSNSLFRLIGKRRAIILAAAFRRRVK